MKKFIETAKRGGDLLVEEAEDAFQQILSGQISEDEIGEFLLALKEKGESKDEILGAIKTLRSKIKTFDFTNVVPENLMDVCGTGGDGLKTLNISTAVAFVIAGAGVAVAKHGNKAVSSAAGSSDVLSELGIKLDIDPAFQLKAANLSYFHAPYYYEAMKIVAPIRTKLKTRTIFNLLGPLLNPAHAKLQLIGVYSPKLLRTFAEVLRELGTKKAWIVHGKDGIDEISISDETYVCELQNGVIDTFAITPEDARIKRQPLEAIKGSDAKHNAEAIRQLLSGEKSAYRDIVLLNAAAALLVAGKAQNLLEGAKLAAESIDSGKAKQVLEKLKTI